MTYFYGLAQSATSVRPPPRLAARCYELQLVIPRSFEELEKEVERWIATCVQSRTIVAGGAAHREYSLVRGNPTLRQVWEQLRDGAGQKRAIRAEYVWGPNRVESIRFSAPVSVYTFDPEIITVCRFRIADAHRNETAIARQTLQTASRVAGGFEQFSQGLSARGRFGPQVMDNKFWFAKLYQLITFHEIAESRTFRHPGFVLHFIPIFYELYHRALRNWMSGNRSAVHAMWQRHFSSAARPARSGLSAWMNEVSNSIVTGVAAHIQGDMRQALAEAYRSYTRKYCLKNLRFSELHDDFFNANSRRVFDAVAASFFTQMSIRSPLPLSPEMGQFVIGQGAARGAGGLDINEIWRWRQTAWDGARRDLGQ